MGKSRLLKRRQERAGKSLVHEHKGPKMSFLENIYENHHKKLFILPIILFVVSVFIIGYQVSTTGDFIQKGVDLKGGITLMIETSRDIDTDELEKSLSVSFPHADINVKSYSEFGRRRGIIIEASDIDTDNSVAEDNLIKALELLIPEIKGSYSSSAVGSALGSSFFKQTILVVIIAFIFMSLVVFLYFKSFGPSLIVVLCAAADIIETVAITNLLGIKISTAGIAAFLMLIGYSVDTDILLSTRVLKRRMGTLAQRTVGAFNTGIVMTLTTLSAVVIALLFSQSAMLTQIMQIMLIGLLIDLINTWMQNAGLLLALLKKKEKAKEAAAAR